MRVNEHSLCYPSIWRLKMHIFAVLPSFFAHFVKNDLHKNLPYKNIAYSYWIGQIMIEVHKLMMHTVFLEMDTLGHNPFITCLPSYLAQKWFLWSPSLCMYLVGYKTCILKILHILDINRLHNWQNSTILLTSFCYPHFLHKMHIWVSKINR